jgi:hypothetical protein
MALDVNLIPAALAEAQTRRRHLRAWAVGFAPALGLLVVVAALNWSRQARADAAAATAEALASQLDQARAEVRRLTAQVNETSLQVERADALRSKRSWSGLIGLLAKSRPDDVWFANLATDPNSPAATKAAPAARGPQPPKGAATKPVTIDAPRKLHVDGYSVSPTGPRALVSTLKRENVFTRVVLERSLNDADKGRSRFRFEIVVEW